MKDKRGMTLIELIIVVAIIAILGAIAVPAYLGQQKSATRTEAFSNLRTLALLEGQYFAENGTYTPSLGNPGNNNPGNVAIIQTGNGTPANALPGFQPGGGTGQLVFSYWIVQNVTYLGAAQTPCFAAYAKGNSNTRVTNEQYVIDCNNNTNF
ncbi:MAG TPA: hypothetical protein DCP92_00320 [Nitrospiraceae bacterium]|nr:hypothetical protein [Nitrospiraceae bacterium]